MMAYGLPFMSDFITLAAGSAIQRSSSPCPYHHLENNLYEPLIKDEFIVSLRDDYTIDEHLQFLNQNLSESAEKFVRMDHIKSYSILIDERVMHERKSFLLVHHLPLTHTTWIYGTIQASSPSRIT